MTPMTAVTARAVPLPGRDLDTDRLMPARFLKAISFEGIEAHLCADDREALRRQGRLHPFDDPAYQGAGVLVVGANFGCGSSREHAPQALVRWGIRAIIGESFAEIFRGNALLLGLPCVTAAAADVATLTELVTSHPDEEVAIDLESMFARAGDLGFAVALPSESREALRSGTWDATALLLARYEEVERTAARLPYLAGFPTEP